MAKLNKRVVDAAEFREKDYVIWDDELPGFGLRVFASGKRSYVLQYRALGRSRRYTIGLHGVWTAESARQEAKVQLGRVAQGDNPAEERQLDHRAITVKELCTLYLNDMNAGLILGKVGRPKKPTTVVTDTGRIERHITPLLGTRRVKDLTKADINKALKDIMAGKTRVSVKTKKLRGKAIVRGGAGTATRTVGLLGGILTYAVEAGIIAINPAHGLRKPKDNVRTRRLTEAEYRTLGEMLREAGKDEKYATTVEIIRHIALTGCRRSEMIGLMWIEADTNASCLRLIDSKEGTSIRPIGLPIVEFLEAYRETASGTYVFPGYGDDNAFGSFPNHWEQIFKKSLLADITPHVLRHSFASVGNDLGFTEVTIAALVGHAKGSVTSKYIHSLDTALIMAADTIAGYIQGLLDGKQFKQTTYALDAFAHRIARHTGGIEPHAFALTKTDGKSTTAWLLLRGKATVAKASELIAILHDLLSSARLDQRERVRRIVLEEKARLESSLVPAGSYYCSLRLKARANVSGFVNEQIYGVSQLTFLRQFAAETETDWPAALARLTTIRSKLIVRSSAIANVTVDAKAWLHLRSQIEGVLSCLPESNPMPAVWQPLSGPSNEGLVVPTQVNYVAKGTGIFDFAAQPNGGALAVCRWLSLAWLIPKIRERGGAYGASLDFERLSGYLALTSYRDPNLTETLATFDDAGAFLRDLQLSDRDLARSVIGALNGVDPYQLPHAKGLTSLTRYLVGLTEVERQKVRDELFATTATDFRNFADVMDGVRDRGQIVVMGAQEKLSEANRTRGSDWLALNKVM